MNLVQYFQDNCSEFIDKFYIIDNGREKNLVESDFPDFVELCRIETSLEANLQHAHTLQQFINSSKISTNRLLILDSDIVFLSNGWINSLLMNTAFNAFVALQEGSRFLTHPCFILLDSQYLSILNFEEGMKEFDFDTGRLVGLQLVNSGAKVKKMPPTNYFKYGFGYTYDRESILHATSASVRYLPSRNKSRFWKFKIFFLEWSARYHNRLVRKLPLFLLLFQASIRYSFTRISKSLFLRKLM